MMRLQLIAARDPPLNPCTDRLAVRLFQRVLGFLYFDDLKLCPESLFSNEPSFLDLCPEFPELESCLFLIFTRATLC